MGSKTRTNDTAGQSSSNRNNNNYYVRTMYALMLHAGVLAIYILPMWTLDHRDDTLDTTVVSTRLKKNSNAAVLDELHIVSANNLDVRGVSTLRDVFFNDYWGRPMNSESSHKSWRPLSVLSFRWLNPDPDDIWMHRLVNVVTHAAAAQLVGLLAQRLVCFQQPQNNNNSQNTSRLSLLRTLATFAFALHPTHVEVTANAANRPHLLAVLCAVVAADPSLHGGVYVLATVGGLLSCETALFQIVPVLVTLVAIAYLQQRHASYDTRQNPALRGGKLYDVCNMIVSQPNIWGRIVWLVLLSGAYYKLRHDYDTLSIPDGLIRPAENPFFTLEGWPRIYSYLMVTGIHVAKQWDVDYIGSSHEYGHACVEPVYEWKDARLYPVAAIFVVHAVVGTYLVWDQRRRPVWSVGLIWFVVYLSWTATLFPITGVVKVGTFISDRIVVASTVPVAIAQAYMASRWLGPRSTAGSKRSASNASLQRQQRRWYLLTLLTCLAWWRVGSRAREWMDSRTLLESSLQTCPRFAKGHLEISKIHSGLYPKFFNLTKSRWHLQQVEEIDPEYCDVHQQFAHVAVQEHKYSEFEERLVKSLLCPYTMGGATDMWQRYWNVQLDEEQNPPAMLADNRRRYQSYQGIISKAIAEEATKSAQEKRKSPLTVSWGNNGE